MKQLFIFFSALILFSACTDNPNAYLIQGRWKGSSWLNNGSTKQVQMEAVLFEFDSTGQYAFTYKNNTQKGTYKVENDLLFTKAEGQQEMMVKIERLTLDSMILGMNNGGTAETLILIRDDEKSVNKSSENKSYLQLGDDGTYRLRIGQRAQIRVYENATTGAYWDVKKPTDSAIIRINDEYIAENDDIDIVGAGGTRLYTIEGVKKGQDSLVLWHGREWESETWRFNRYAIIVE